MKRNLMGLALLALCFVMGASIASATTACSTRISPPTDVNPGPVGEGGSANTANPNPSSIICTVGTLTFSNFAYKADAGALETLDLEGCQGNVTGCVPAAAGVYGISLNPNLSSPPTQDVALIFEVTSTTPITSVTLVNSGTPIASVSETVCNGAGLNGGPTAAGELSNGTCVNPFLASFATTAGGTQTVNLSAPSTTIWVYKDIGVNSGGTLSNFEQNFNTGSVPEPATMLLVGGVLCGIAAIRRRSVRS
jgi:hypothetical protein